MNKLIVPQSENVLNALKMEIANELDVDLGADTSSRINGSVGGEMTKRLIQYAKEQLSKQQ